MKRKFSIIDILLGLIILALSIILIHRCSTPDTKKGVIINIEEEFNEENIKIELLEDSIKTINLRVDSLLKKETRIDTLRIIEREKIKKLPIDSAVLFLKRKLEKYEEEFKVDL